jgi:tetratricopeptide (TPR) repeat protein
MINSLRVPVLTAAVVLFLVPATGCNRLKARDQLNKGVQSYKSARYEEAIDHFQDAVNLDPTLPMAHLYLATAYAQQVVPNLNTPENLKTAQLAISAFQAVLEKDPKDVGSLKGIAALYFNINQPDLAEQYQKRVLEVDPHDAEAHYTIGVIDWKKAYNNAIKVRNSLNQQDDENPIKDKKACAELREQNMPFVTEGIDQLNQAVADRKNYADAMAYLNLLYRRRAELNCDDKAAHDADLQTAKDYVQKAMDAKKKEEEEKANQPGGIVIEQGR